MFVVLNLSFGLFQAGIEGGVASAIIALIIGLPIVVVRRWFRGRGNKKQEAEVDAELARIRAANADPKSGIPPNP